MCCKLSFQDAGPRNSPAEMYCLGLCLLGIIFIVMATPLANTISSSILLFSAAVLLTHAKTYFSAAESHSEEEAISQSDLAVILLDFV